MIYAPALFASSMVAAIVGSIAWRRRSAPGARELAATMLAIGAWAFAYSMRWISTDVWWAKFWLNATFIGVVTAPTALLFLVLRFTGNESVFRIIPPSIFVIEPVLTLILIWTDVFHGFFYGGETAIESILNWGTWFWFNVIYSYGLNLMAVVILVIQMLRSRNMLRRQAAIILAGITLPWFGNILSIAGKSPFPGLDLTPFLFTLSGVILAFGLFRFGLLDIVPFARDILVEKMPEGLMVTDRKMRIVDLNPAAASIFDLKGSVIGRPIAEVLPMLPELLRPLEESDESRIVFGTEHSSQRHYEIRTSPLKGRGNRNLGSLILFRDITERKRTEDELLYRSTHDILTGLSNREHFEWELERMKAVGVSPIGFAMLDVDGLKEVNDSLGHGSGDELLREAAGVILSCVKPGDFPARIGGDEFIVILPGATEKDTRDFTIALDSAIAAYNENPGCGMPLGISVGFSCTQTAGKETLSIAETLRKADASMYVDKNARKLLRSAG